MAVGKVVVFCNQQKTVVVVCVCAMCSRFEYFEVIEAEINFLERGLEFVEGSVLHVNSNYMRRLLV